jgi:hypothetical protein
MILHDYPWEIKLSVVRRIYFLGDLHVGNAAFDEGNCKRVIDLIKENDNARYFFMGDGAECISINDKRRWEFAALDPKFHQSVDNLAQAQINYVCQLLEPIKGKCIGYHAGNHELDIMRANRDYDPMFDYHTLFLEPARDLGSDVAVTRIKFATSGDAGGHVDIVKVFTTHGMGYATTQGGKLNKLVRLADSFPGCNIYARGHLHDCGIHAEPALDVPNKGALRLIENQRMFVAAGCFFRTYSVGHPNYAARRSYRATQLGTAYIDIVYQHDTHAGPMKLKMTFGIEPS